MCCPRQGTLHNHMKKGTSIMKKTSHTPGPWRRGITLETQETARWSEDKIKSNNLHEQKNVFAFFSGADDGKSRAHICQLNDSSLDYEANAALIAAAPDLLESVELARTFLDSLPEGWFGKTSGDVAALNQFFITSSAAIKKAQG